MKKWTEEEIEWLKENYKTASWEEILKKLPHSKSAILTKANRQLGLKKADKEIQYRWNKEYDDFLKANYENGDMNEMAEVLSYPIHTIQCRANNLGLKRNPNLNRNFTEEDDEWLRKNYGSATKSEIESRFPDKKYQLKYIKETTKITN